MRKRIRRQTIAAVLATMTMVAGVACGNDDDETAATTTTDGTGTETAAGFCEGYIQLTSGDPSPEQIREVASEAPDEGRQALEAIAAGFEAEGEAFFESEAFGENFETIGRVAADECADETIAVTGVDYEFEGVPAEVPAGMVAVDFSNEGTEFHEMVVFRRNEGVEQSFDEIFAAGEEEAEALLTQAGASFAAPGESASGLMELSEAGDYVAVCFIPQGSTPDNDEASGPPHFTLGMKAEFTVS